MQRCHKNKVQPAVQPTRWRPSHAERTGRTVHRPRQMAFEPRHPCVKPPGPPPTCMRQVVSAVLPVGPGVRMQRCCAGQKHPQIRLVITRHHRKYARPRIITHAAILIFHPRISSLVGRFIMPGWRLKEEVGANIRCAAAAKIADWVSDLNLQPGVADFIRQFITPAKRRPAVSPILFSTSQTWT